LSLTLLPNIPQETSCPNNRQTEGTSDQVVWMLSRGYATPMRRKSLICRKLDYQFLEGL
jgi:hypothetical protein